MKKEKILDAYQTRAKLKVNLNTVYSWIRVGRLKTIKGKKPYQIFASCLADAVRSKCRLCGKEFKCMRPLRAKFCTQKHHDAWHTARLKKLNKSRRRR